VIQVAESDKFNSVGQRPTNLLINVPTLKGSQTAIECDPYRVSTFMLAKTGALPPAIELFPCGELIDYSNSF
jgi:hypothetical protein